MKSPCKKQCSMGRGGKCVACFRTAKEIVMWMNYTDEEREEIMKDCVRREKKWRDENAL